MGLAVETLVDKAGKTAPAVTDSSMLRAVMARFPGAVIVLLSIALGAVAAALAQGGGPDGRVGELSERVEANRDRLAAVERAVAASDSAERVAAIEARLAAADRADDSRDDALARLTVGLETQIEVSRYIGANLERIGAKVGAKLEPMPSELLSAVNQVRLDSARRRYGSHE